MANDSERRALSNVDLPMLGMLFVFLVERERDEMREGRWRGVRGELG